MSDFKAKFSLFNSKEKTSEKSPDKTGNIEIASSEVAALVAYLQDPANTEEDWQGNSVVKIRLAAWNATSKGGLDYINGLASKPLPPMAQSPTAAQASSTESLPF